MASSPPLETSKERLRIRELLLTPPSSRPADWENPLEKIEQLLTCPICLDRYKSPRLLPCHHTFCLPCLEGLVDSLHRNLKCPECRAEHSLPYDGVKAFQTNYTLVGFLDIHLQASDENAEQLEEYIHRYNMTRCKVCDEKSSDCELCAHCEKLACKECRASHSDMLRRDLSRLLSQVKRLSNRITEASDGLSKGLDLLAMNCETARADVKEYFHRNLRELKKRIESSNMSEGVARLEAALKGECSMSDEELVHYKNTFSEGLDYLRAFQPDADEHFAKKIRFSAGDDASKLPTAIASFGELCVQLPQFAGRYLPLEQSYLPRPFKIGLESDSYRLKKRDEDGAANESRPQSRFSTKEDDTSIRFRRRQQLEEEAWNRLRGATEDSRKSKSPWSRPPEVPREEQREKNEKEKESEKDKTRALKKPPRLPRQASSGEDSSLNEKVEVIRAAHERRKEESTTSNPLPPVTTLPAPPSQAPQVVVDEAVPVPLPQSKASHFPGLEAPKEREEEGPPSPIPIEHYPGEELLSVSTNTPAWLLRRRQRFQRSRTNPDLQQSFSSSRVQQLLQERSARLENSATTRTSNAPSRHDSDDEEAPIAPPPVAERAALRLRRRSMLIDDDGNDYKGRGKPRLVIGKKGSGSGELNWPRGLTAIGSTEFAVADSSNHRIVVMNSRGDVLRSFGSYGSGDGQLDSAADVACNSHRQLIVSDRYNHRIVIFDDEGRFVSAFGGHGPGNGRFNNPWGVCVDDSNNIYVNHRVQYFTRKGDFMGKFGVRGSGVGQLHNPLFIAFCRRSQRLFLSDSSNHRITVWDSHGSYLFAFGCEGFHAGQLKFPRGVAGNVIVADSGNNRVQVFNSEGGFLHSFGQWGSGPGQLKGLESVCLLAGQILVSDRENHRLQLF